MPEPLTKGKFTEFYWTAPGQPLERITDRTYQNHPFFKQDQQSAGRLNQFIRNELGLGTKEGAGEAAKHIEYMRRHDLVDYCETSEKGHMKWYPKGWMMAQLLTQYGRTLAREWGAFEMKNPILIRGDQNQVGQLMGEFHERDYKVDGGRGVGFLRYASDPLGFPFMQKVRFTQAQSPLKVYEEAYCFRNEQDGEVSGLKRMRWFIMTDMHAACASLEQAKEEYGLLTERFAGLMNDLLAKGRWVLGWEVAKEHYDPNAAWFKELSDRAGAPSLIKVMPHMSHYYAFKNEFQSITADKSNVQISTVQWDVKNGPRFDIGYIGSDGKKVPSPVIIHASSIGSVERALCSILENIAIDEREGIPPAFPLWLAPTQLRVIPVSDRHIIPAVELANHYNRAQVRADVDDRNETLGKRIAASERDWVPYTIVIGDAETVDKSPLLKVRVRSSKEQLTRTKNEIAEMIHDQTKELRDPAKDLPFLPLPLPVQISRRPLFK